MIPKSQDSETARLEKLRPARVTYGGYCVLPSIELDNKPRGDASEVGDERTDGTLTTKFMPR